MSNPDDVLLLDRDEKDLQRCDLSQLVRTGGEYSGIDFKGSSFESSDFSNSIFRDCDFRDCKLVHANFSDSRFIGCHFDAVAFGVKFIRAEFRGGSFKSLVTRSDLTDAKFFSVTVKGLRFNEGNTLEGAIADSVTDFTGVPMPRELARKEIFSGYNFTRGALVKKVEVAVPDAELGGKSFSEELSKRNEIAVLVAKLEHDISELCSQSLPSSQQAVMMGHNNPPVEFCLNTEECAVTLESIKAVGHLVETSTETPEQLRPHIETLQTTRKKLKRWLGEKVNLAIDEFAKQSGKTLGDAKTYIGGWFLIQGGFDRLLTLLTGML